MEHKEQHPWNWYGPQNSHTLIIGTFPPTKRNWSFDFFYPNKRNFFWKILSGITSKDLLQESGEAAVEERKAILDELKITITDMGQTIVRMDNNSLDENLHPIAYMDILQILQERPLIRKIVFTSSSGKVSATRWFQNYLVSRDIVYKFPKMPKPVRDKLTLNGRTIELVILYSPSARAANRISFEPLMELYKQELLKSVEGVE